MLKEMQGASSEDKAFMLAMAVMRDRLESLSPEDREDMFELTKAFLTATDEEDRESAAVAMMEIFDGPKIRARASSLSGGAPKEWVAFISQRIRNLRRKASMSQEELATKSGLTQSHISRLENGEHSPTGLTLEKIAAALGVEASQLDPSASE